MSRSATVLTSAPLELPWQRLQQAVATALGTTVPITVDKIAQVRFLIVGTAIKSLNIHIEAEGFVSLDENVPLRFNEARRMEFTLDSSAAVDAA